MFGRPVLKFQDLRIHGLKKDLESSLKEWWYYELPSGFALVVTLLS